MHAPRLSRATGTHLGSTSEQLARTAACWVTLGMAGSLVAVYVLLALGRSALALLAGALCASMAMVWALLFPEALRASAGQVPHMTNIGSPMGDLSADGSGRYLDIDAVEVEAVYVLDAEVFTHLTGGVGSILDPLSGDERHIETSDVSLTWRCQGRRSAAKLAGRLNEWEARGAHLRLMAARGHCALLIEDDDHWVALPELRLTA
jgi:hypothetical protein